MVENKFSLQIDIIEKSLWKLTPAKDFLSLKQIKETVFLAIDGIR